MKSSSDLLSTTLWNEARWAAHAYFAPVRAVWRAFKWETWESLHRSQTYAQTGGPGLRVWALAFGMFLGAIGVVFADWVIHKGISSCHPVSWLQIPKFPF